LRALPGTTVSVFDQFDTITEIGNRNPTGEIVFEMNNVSTRQWIRSQRDSCPENTFEKQAFPGGWNLGRDNFGPAGSTSIGEANAGGLGRKIWILRYNAGRASFL